MEFRYCKKCFNIEPCTCCSNEYISTWDFVYYAFRNLKGS